MILVYPKIWRSLLSLKKSKLPELFLNSVWIAFVTLWTKRDSVFIVSFMSPNTNAQAFSVSLVTQSCLTLFDHMDCSPTRLLCAWDSPGKNTGVGCHSLLQGTFQTQGLNSGLLYCRQIVLPSEPPGKPLRLFAHFKFLYSANSNKIRHSLPSPFHLSNTLLP